MSCSSHFSSLQRSAQSPDLNPAASFGAEAEQDVQSFDVLPKNLQELSDVIDSVWTNIPMEPLQQPCQGLREAKGALMGISQV